MIGRRRILVFVGCERRYSFLNICFFFFFYHPHSQVRPSVHTYSYILSGTLHTHRTTARPRQEKSRKSVRRTNCYEPRQNAAYYYTYTRVRSSENRPAITRTAGSRTKERRGKTKKKKNVHTTRTERKTTEKKKKKRKKSGNGSCAGHLRRTSPGVTRAAIVVRVPVARVLPL